MREKIILVALLSLALIAVLVGTTINNVAIKDLRGDLAELKDFVGSIQLIAEHSGENVIEGDATISTVRKVVVTITPAETTWVEVTPRTVSYEIAPLGLGWKADYHTRFEMTKDLFLEIEKIEGVSWVTGYRYQMEVGKADMFSWDEIHPKIMKALNNY